MREISKDMKDLIQASMDKLTGDEIIPVAGLSNHYIALSENLADATYRPILSLEIRGKTVHLFFRR